jgi:hypothetical protein
MRLKITDTPVPIIGYTTRDHASCRSFEFKFAVELGSKL